jgi:hypothetical protein
MTNPSPRPPTGLADGFGPELPYGEPQPLDADAASRFTPGDTNVGPRLPGLQGLGGCRMKPQNELHAAKNSP